MRPLGLLFASACLFVACANGPPAARYAPMQDGWTHVCEPNRFVVDFPAPPTEGRETLQGADGPLVAVTWNVIHGQRSYLLEYAEYDDVTRPPAEIVAIMRENVAKHARVLDDRRQSGEGWASDDLLLEDRSHHMVQVRIVMSRQQLWNLITASRSFEDDQASATRFLQSIGYRDAARDCD